MEVSVEAKDGLGALPSSGLQALVLRALHDEGVAKLHRLAVTPGSVLGDNFMCVIHRVSAEGVARAGQPRLLSLILKCQPGNEARRKFFSVDLLFRNEVNFYERVIPRLQQGTLVSLGVPQCLCSLQDSQDDALVLEDLRPAGFRMVDRVSGLDEPHCRLVLRELARLHALSLALRARDPEKFQQLTTQVKDILFDDDRKPAFEPFILSSYKETLRIVLKYYDNDHENIYVKVMKRIAEGGFELIAGIVHDTPEHERVITHGDCWTNNLQFRYDEDEPVDVRLLDFQLTRVSTPALDVTYILFTSLRYGLLASCYDELLTCYHASLASTLTELGLAVEDLFPRIRLDQEMARCAAYGVAMAGIVVPAVYCPPEHAPDLESVTGDTADAFVQEYARQMKAETPEGRRHLASLLQHSVERGFLKHLVE